MISQRARKEGLSVSLAYSAPNAGLVLLHVVSFLLVSEETLSKRVKELEMEPKEAHIDI
jgi:hypothetical protein